MAMPLSMGSFASAAATAAALPFSEAVGCVTAAARIMLVVEDMVPCSTQQSHLHRALHLTVRK